MGGREGVGKSQRGKEEMAPENSRCECVSLGGTAATRCPPKDVGVQRGELDRRAGPPSVSLNTCRGESAACPLDMRIHHGQPDINPTRGGYTGAGTARLVLTVSATQDSAAPILAAASLPSPDAPRERRKGPSGGIGS